MPIRKSILIMWILITLFAPFAIFFWMIVGNTAAIGDIVYAFLWAYIPEGASNDISGPSIFGIRLPIEPTSIFSGFHILDPLVLQWVPIFGMFNIFFAVQVVRHTQEKVSFRQVLIIGLLTLAFPLYQTIIYGSQILRYESYFYAGPIPIQLIIGLIIAKKYGPKPLEAPWE